MYKGILKNVLVYEIDVQSYSFLVNVVTSKMSPLFSPSPPLLKISKLKNVTV